MRRGSVSRVGRGRGARRPEAQTEGNDSSLDAPHNDAPLDDAAAQARQRSKARHTAVGLLARREHAQSEIQRKLQQRGYDRDTTNQVVDELTRQRLLSDERFAESFIRARAERGQGPVRLRAELRQLKLSAEMIAQHLAAAGIEWDILARQIRERRFGRGAPESVSERAKQVRFLQYRGFTAAHIRAAMGSSCDDLMDADDAAEFDPE